VQFAEPLMTALERIRTVLGSHLHKRGEIELLAGGPDSVHVAIDGPCSARGVAELVGGPIVGVRAGQRQEGAEAVELEPGLQGSADRFAQASLAGNQALLSCVADALPARAESALELYAGSGNLTRALTDVYDRVFACDVVPPAGGPPQGVQWRAGHAERVTATLAGAGVAIDVVVLDPPRSGARECMGPIAKLGPKRVIYVSCDPATMARDLVDLGTSGYQTKWLQPFDLMPQTSHVEVVAIADRVD
jgi:23S rRNA (uracil1939-C5)-methyltransferase